ncbi:MAG TPA: carboxypeptidase-like regulatory domain-containing protein, partial [Pseudacidobacterium sp.]|nr:carboxypeptidase-like regulatory domain-containing protein [Pseudacidobacterium sp.]
MKSCALWLLLLSCCVAISSAQQLSSDKAAPTTTVSGHVYCGDTNAPARMATVMLEPVSEASGTSHASGHESVSTYAPAVQTLLDGSFSMQHVAPGTYYVIASLPGYVSPLGALAVSATDIEKPDDSLKEQIAKGVPRIKVQANLPASIDITLERGASVSGTVLYDDGSPAVGLEVHLLVRKKDKWTPMQSSPFDMSIRTDDRGAYRINGLPALEFLTEVDLRLTKITYEFGGGGTGMSFESGYSLSIYSGSRWRQKDATPFSPKPGEDRTGEDIQIPISQLHNIRGTITAVRDGHVVNGGKVSLLYADDKTEALSTNLMRDDNGFAFIFVPEGDYILRVADASDVEYEDIPNPPHSVPPTRTVTHSLRRYGSTDQPIHVDGDVIG